MTRVDLTFDLIDRPLSAPRARTAEGAWVTFGFDPSLDRATTMAWKAVNMLGVTDEEWELVKREIGIDRGWEAAYLLVSTFDLPGSQPSVEVTADSP